ncbi:hypothetical protein CKO38_12910 [Rhodospirillum rubrum]|nr:hypothetical protein [Rhodospirillum rubrum]MBK1677550.1 hypothetical protein [Rhodospirillum rubrum]
MFLLGGRKHQGLLNGLTNDSRSCRVERPPQAPKPLIGRSPMRTSAAIEDFARKGIAMDHPSPNDSDSMDDAIALRVCLDFLRRRAESLDLPEVAFLLERARQSLLDRGL